MTQAGPISTSALEGAASPLINRARANALMDSADLGGIVVSSEENIAYASGFHAGLFNRPQRRRLVFVVVPRDEDLPCAMVIPHYYLSYLADRHVAVDQIWTYGFYHIADQNDHRDDGASQHFRKMLADVRSADDGIKGLLSALDELNLSDTRLGLDEDGITHHAFQAIEQSEALREIVPAADLLREVRMVKTQEEIARLRESTRITEAGLTRVVGAIQAGVTEHELELTFRQEVARQEGLFTFAALPAGTRSAFPACLTSDYAIQPGDLVKLDAGCLYRLYHSDVGRTAVLGEPSEKQAHLYEAMWAGTREAVAFVKPGVLASDVYQRAMQAARDAGIPDFKRHHCGHGQGLEGYEPPLIALDDHTPLQSGMVLNIETPYNEVGFGGMIIEETIVVTEDGCEQITSIDSGLHVI